MAVSSDQINAPFNLECLSDHHTLDKEKWIDSFLATTYFKKMDWSEALDRLKPALSNRARLWFDSLTEKELSGPAEFREAFSKRFLQCKLDMQTMNSLTQGLDESVVSYYNTVVMFGQKLKMDGNSIMIKFLSGLREPIKSVTCIKKPKSTAEACQIAMVCESLLASKAASNSEKSAPKGGCDVHESKALLNDMTESENALKSVGPQRKPQSRCTHCYQKQQNEKSGLIRDNFTKVDLVIKLFGDLRALSGTRYQSRCPYCLLDSHNLWCCRILKRDLLRANFLYE